MSILQSLLSSLSRCSTARSSCLGSRCFTTNRGPLYLQVTPALWAEPLKKKRRVDPGVLKGREDRKKRRLEKSIRKLEKNEGQLKPIEETEVSLTLQKEKKLRERVISTISEAEQDERWSLEMEWCRLRSQQSTADKAVILGALKAQQKALMELRLVSEDLWLEALHEDQFVFPFRSSGPLSSLPIPGYDHPDGDYKDVSKNWD